MPRVGVLLAAIALDLAFGEPPNRVHPVAWLGRALAAGHRRLCRGSRRALLLRGAGVTLAVAALSALGGALLDALGARLGVVGVALEAVALARLLSVRRLAAAAPRVGTHPRHRDLAPARESGVRDLLSRPTDAVDS